MIDVRSSIEVEMPDAPPVARPRGVDGVVPVVDVFDDTVDSNAVSDVSTVVSSPEIPVLPPANSLRHARLGVFVAIAFLLLLWWMREKRLKS